LTTVHTSVPFGVRCEFPAADGWQVEGKRRIVGHDGCGAGLIAQGSSIGHRFCYVNPGFHATAVMKISGVVHNPG
jgi:hypothetical protein